MTKNKMTVADAVSLLRKHGVTPEMYRSLLEDNAPDEWERRDKGFEQEKVEPNEKIKPYDIDYIPRC